ncbi:MAG TPA: signal peptidase I [Bacillota bacterium]|nr:signal peptidase I [Bacillota bacterium]HPZ65370.1 signal peptidase I [Bacillota bacterium]
MSSKSKEIWEWIRSIGIALAVALFIRIFLFEFFVVEGRSMYPTLDENERLVVNKFIYRFESPQPGDIVVFQFEPHRDFIKRVIGVEGDTIEIKDGRVFRNGKLMEEPYLLEDMEPQDFGPVLVPPGTVFLLGDYRMNSLDSRDPSVGFVSLEQIKGKALYVFWPIWEARSLEVKVAE